MYMTGMSSAKAYQKMGAPPNSTNIVILVVIPNSSDVVVVVLLVALAFVCRQEMTTPSIKVYTV